MPVERFAENPLVTPADVPPSWPDLEVICTFNAGVTKYKDETILLLRVAERASSAPDIARVPIISWYGDTPAIKICEFDLSDPTIDASDPRSICTPQGIMLTSISHLRVARSKDGRNFTVDPEPALFPDRLSEIYGLEDPRITQLDGKYYITYKSVAPTGISTSLAVTEDFRYFEKLGIIFNPENLDVCIFPEKIDGRYAALHRPVPRMFGLPNIWLGYSPDLVSWGDHHLVMEVEADTWASGRIGAGAVPIKTEHGWLEIYHGATAENVYCLGAVLLDLEDPYKIIARSKSPLMKPEASYELEGFVPNVIFSCGLVRDGDRLTIYYGAADTVMAAAEVSLQEVLDSLLI
jgi:beta-1,2-mannobiose phosphorylase / 1,2-beta-oligomannan phosphorylase